jgi:raffinose/stachyose/melibiose transport system permease protein
MTLSVLLLLLLVGIFLFPVYLAVISSFKTENEIYRSAIAFPTQLYFGNYAEGIRKSNFLPAMLNSCMVVFPSVAMIVLCTSMGGYTIARNSTKSKVIKAMDTVYLASLMLPFTIMMIPVYKLFKMTGLLNNLFGYAIMLTGTSIAYATFLYTGFVKSVPKELEESAMIDGAGPYRSFFSIVFPLLAPITATISALHIMWLWNDFNIAIILLQKEAARTLTVKQFYFFGEHSSEYGNAFAASLLCMMPVLFFYVLMQRYIVAGISAGAVKS